MYMFTCKIWPCNPKEHGDSGLAEPTGKGEQAACPDDPAPGRQPGLFPQHHSAQRKMILL